jgi:hypothetical protein
VSGKSYLSVALMGSSNAHAAGICGMAGKSDFGMLIPAGAA